MTTVEIILLVAGILCLIASFMIPDEKKKESKEESSVNRQHVQELTQAEQDKVRERINDIINEQLGDISEKTEAQLDKISNTKILVCTLEKSSFPRVFVIKRQNSTSRISSSISSVVLTGSSRLTSIGLDAALIVSLRNAILSPSNAYQATLRFQVSLFWPNA